MDQCISSLQVGVSQPHRQLLWPAAGEADAQINLVAMRSYLGRLIGAYNAVFERLASRPFPLNGPRHSPLTSDWFDCNNGKLPNQA